MVHKPITQGSTSAPFDIANTLTSPGNNGVSTIVVSVLLARMVDAVVAILSALDSSVSHDCLCFCIMN